MGVSPYQAAILLTRETSMKTTIALLLAATAFSVPAVAQTNAPTTSSPMATTATMATPMNASSEWRASKLIGVNVYNEQNNSVGEIDEVLLDHTGKIAGFVIGVGGFLGMGEHEVLIPFNQVKFVNEPVRTTSTTPTTTPRPATTGAATTNAAATTKVRDKSEKWYPDHAVINATKDQLKAMQQFKYN
jgi:sporulation protein YlmC with PRC-barrel domain